jgi:RNA recognition motif-containing protein
MTSEVKMPLDEVIKKRIKEDKTGKTRRLAMSQRNKRFRKRKNYTPSSTSKDTRRRIRIENLHKEMQNSELTQLFQTYGKLTRCGIKFDKMGVSTGIADVEFSTHEECEKAIQTLDNAEIKGEKLRVKYANPIGRYSRRIRSAGYQRRSLRRMNRNNRRERPRAGRRIGRRGVRPRASSTRKSVGGRRKVFSRTLGRRRQLKK